MDYELIKFQSKLIDKICEMIQVVEKFSAKIENDAMKNQIFGLCCALIVLEINAEEILPDTCLKIREIEEKNNMRIMNVPARFEVALPNGEYRAMREYGESEVQI